MHKSVKNKFSRKKIKKVIERKNKPLFEKKNLFEQASHRKTSKYSAGTPNESLDKNIKKLIAQKKKLYTKSIYNIENNNEEENDQFSLKKDYKFNDRTNEEIDAHFVSKFHFGGLNDEEPKQTRKDFLQEMIHFSKKEKHEKQKEKEALDNVRNDLDLMWKELRTFVKPPEAKKEIDRDLIENHPKTIIPEKVESYDMIFRDLQFNTRTRTQDKENKNLIEPPVLDKESTKQHVKNTVSFSYSADALTTMDQGNYGNKKATHNKQNLKGDNEPNDIDDSDLEEEKEFMLTYNLEGDLIDNKGVFERINLTELQNCNAVISERHFKFFYNPFYALPCEDEQSTMDQINMDFTQFSQQLYSHVHEKTTPESRVDLAIQEFINSYLKNLPKSNYPSSDNKNISSFHQSPTTTLLVQCTKCIHFTTQYILLSIFSHALENTCAKVSIEKNETLKDNILSTQILSLQVCQQLFDTIFVTLSHKHPKIFTNAFAIILLTLAKHFFDTDSKHLNLITKVSKSQEKKFIHVIKNILFNGQTNAQWCEKRDQQKFLGVWVRYKDSIPTFYTTILLHAMLNSKVDVLKHEPNLESLSYRLIDYIFQQHILGPKCRILFLAENQVYTNSVQKYIANFHNDITTSLSRCGLSLVQRLIYLTKCSQERQSVHNVPSVWRFFETLFLKYDLSINTPIRSTSFPILFNRINNNGDPVGEIVSYEFLYSILNTLQQYINTGESIKTVIPTAFPQSLQEMLGKMNKEHADSPIPALLNAIIQSLTVSITEEKLSYDSLKRLKSKMSNSKQKHHMTETPSQQTIIPQNNNIKRPLLLDPLIHCYGKRDNFATNQIQALENTLSFKHVGGKRKARKLRNLQHDISRIDGLAAQIKANCKNSKGNNNASQKTFVTMDRLNKLKIKTQQEQRKMLAHIYKRDIKTARKRLRNEAQMNASTQIQDRLSRDMERKNKVKNLYSILANQEGEVKALRKRKL